MINVRMIKAIMMCEGKSKEQAIFYYLRTINNYSYDYIKAKTGLKINAIKKAERSDYIFKRVGIGIQKKLLKVYKIENLNEIITKLDSIVVYPDEMVSIYQNLFSFSHLKAMLYVHSKINGCSKKEYQHLVRISRVNLNKHIDITRISKLMNYPSIQNMVKIS